MSNKCVRDEPELLKTITSRKIFLFDLIVRVGRLTSRSMSGRYDAERGVGEGVGGEREYIESIYIYIYIYSFISMNNQPGSPQKHCGRTLRYVPRYAYL